MPGFSWQHFLGQLAWSVLVINLLVRKFCFQQKMDASEQKQNIKTPNDHDSAIKIHRDKRYLKTKKHPRDSFTKMKKTVYLVFLHRRLPRNVSGSLKHKNWSRSDHIENTNSIGKSL